MPWGRYKVPENADKYWQQPPALDKGDDNPEQIWARIGSALTTWEMIEQRLSTMFRVFVESRSPAADRAYGAIASARGRIDALRAAADVFFQLHSVADTWKKEFDLLVRHASAASGRRNEIAHGVVIACEFDGVDAGVFLVPAGYNTRKTHAFEQGIGLADKFSMLKVKYRYTAEQISDITSRFHVLNSAANEWTMNLWIKYPSDKYDKA
jgi:hypothetical protein